MSPPPPARLCACSFAHSRLLSCPMAGSSSGAGAGAGASVSRYNLRPRGRLRGAAALSNSPLLGRLLEELSAVFDAEVLPRLDPTARALFGRAGRACWVGSGG